ncbi:MAG: carbon-nitrogen hydrolase family protein [Deltaproteobacteria bacterium]|nr:carbon-nitrogen hydrolase family protein [Deltaproteobacteria bacterium]
MESVRVAVVQAASAGWDREASLARVERYTAEAAEQGARLVLFPEVFVGGYPKGLDFGTRVGGRSAEGRDQFRRYFEGAVEVPGEATERLGACARGHGVELVVGVLERDGGTLYCTALFLGPDGALRGRHRKLVPTAAERLLWGQGDGSTLPVLETPVGRLGAVICWENYMPLLRFAMYARGVELYLAPTADDRETWLSTLRHIALEGRCFVLSACQYLTRADLPEDAHPLQGEAPETVLLRGGSCVVGPLGEVLAGPDFTGPAVLLADLDARALARARFDFDVAGHYGRPDLFRLEVDARPRPAVSWLGAPPEGATPARSRR